MRTLNGTPDRIFVSVDSRTARSTISVRPADLLAPFQLEDDGDGSKAMVEAKAIAARHGNVPIDGPHFHTSSETPRKRRRF